MRFITTACAASLLALSFGTSAIADGHVASAIKERQESMKGYGKALGVLGNMAKGANPYDAAAASAAADQLAKLANMDHSDFWPEGSDISVKGSRALPKLFENLEDVKAIEAKLAAASTAMAAVAGDGLPAVQGAIGGIGAACGECHKAYRQPK
jgi:cytochrome c556